MDIYGVIETGKKAEWEEVSFNGALIVLWLLIK